MDGGRHDGFISKPYTRTGNNSTQDGLVEYSIEAKPEIKSIFKEAELPTPSFNKLKKNDNKAIDTFKNAIAKAKQSLGDYGASVELKDDYKDINLYLSEDGESGFGIKPNGDIVSVFSNNKAEGGRSAYMLEMAISQGGRQLDCFDVYLVEIYEAHGFKPVAKMKWNDEYIPEGWNKENFKDYNNGEPALTAGRRHVVFMVYDPNNDIEKQHESLEDTMEEIEKKRGYRYKRKTREDKIPYIIDYDDGEKFQHQYKWRSPAEREAIYNNMLKRYKNAKTTEELKKVVFDNDKPLEVFNRQLDDLGSLSKEQAQSIRAEYSKRYLELIKDENPEEYKKNKKYLEKKYNIKSDASIYIDSLIDTIAYIDAKKKEFKEEDVNRDEDGKFAKKNSSSNKSNNKSKDNDKKENDKRKLKKIDFNNIKKVNNIKEVKRAEATLNKFYDEDYLKNEYNKSKNELKKDLKEHLKYLDEEGSKGALFNNIRKRIEDALNDKNNMASAEDIKKAISKLPKAQQSSAELIYNNNGSKKANELFSKYEQTIDELKLKKDESKTGAAKRMVYRELTDGAKAIYGFSSIADYKFYKEGRDKEIINLINNNPNPPATVYRGEGLNRIAFKNIQIGQSYFEIKQNNTVEENYGKDIEIKDVNSSNASYDMGTAFKFADESAGTKVVHVFENTKNISSVSYYDYENECFIDKREQILYDIYQANNGTYYLMYQPKNNNDNKIDAKKKEFKESDVNRDAGGRFAKKNSSSKNKSKDKKDNDIKDNDKRTIKERIKSLPKHLQDTGNKLYNNNPIPSDLIIKDDANYDTEDILSYIDDDMVDEEKYSQLNEIETLLNRFTENAQGTRESNTFKRLKKDIEELIENAPPVKNPHRVEYMIEGRDDLSIGTTINFDIRSFADFGAGDKTANKIYNYLRDEVDPSKLVVYVIDDEVNALDMTTISSYPNQNECLINGDFIISEVEEGDEYNPPIVHLKKPKK